MNTKKALVILVLVITGFTLSGCFYVNSEFRHIRNQLFSGVKFDYEKDTEFALGPFSLWMARGVISIADVDGETEGIIQNISEVQIGVYKNRNRRSSTAEADPEVFKALTEQMESHGWTRIVKSFDGKEFTSILVKTEGNKLSRMFVITFDPKEMVLTDIRGNLSKLAMHAIKERRLKLDKHS